MKDVLSEALSVLEGHPLREGTWAIPDTPEKKAKAAKLIKQLDAWKREAYDVLGDDTVFDSINDAVKRAQQLMDAKLGPKGPHSGGRMI